ncbi:MAG: hypothetical protein ACRDQF_13480 [Thermocrispum sp.]
MRAEQRLGRATHALPNGYCGLPVQQTCPMFITTAEFLPQHWAHQQQVLQIITAAEARGQTRLVEMNQQVTDNLDKIIATLENDNGKHPDRTRPDRPARARLPERRPRSPPHT